MVPQSLAAQAYLRVVDERSTLTVGRKVTGGGIFETLDDGLAIPISITRPLYKALLSYRFPRPIVANDQR